MVHFIRCYKESSKYLSNDYNNKHDMLCCSSYSSASPNDLFSALTDNSEQALMNFMKQWSEQPGHPMINVTMLGDSVVITQQRFLYNRSVVNNQTWDIPLTYTTSVNPNFDNYTFIWFPSNATNITIKKILPGCRGWLVFNVNYIGKTNPYLSFFSCFLKIALENTMCT